MGSNSKDKDKGKNKDAPVAVNPDENPLSHQERYLESMYNAGGNSGQLLRRRVVTLDRVRESPDILMMIRQADAYLRTIGYTDHGMGHVTLVSERAMLILSKLGYSEREIELGGIAGFMHDLGNVIHRNEHAQSGGLMALHVLLEMGMNMAEACVVANAIANHDEDCGEPVSAVCAALIIADKSDVRRSRVRSDLVNTERKLKRNLAEDIHDRVNFAVEKSQLVVDPAGRNIDLQLTIDTKISQVMEYFEIFLSRMQMSRASAKFLNCDLRLIINDVKLM